MRTWVIAILALCMLAAAGISNAGADETVLKTMQAENATDNEEDTVVQNWNSFVENFDHQNEVTNATISGNITYMEAANGFVATYILNSQSLLKMQSMTPSEKYFDFHNYTLQGTKYLNLYLYDMAKYFETNNSKYARMALPAWNMTVMYYELGRDEADLLF